MRGADRPHQAPGDDSAKHHAGHNVVWHQEAGSNVELVEVKIPPAHSRYSAHHIVDWLLNASQQRNGRAAA